jgi:hypothetical protein
MIRMAYRNGSVIEPDHGLIFRPSYCGDVGLRREKMLYDVAALEATIRDPREFVFGGCDLALAGAYRTATNKAPTYASR